MTDRNPLALSSLGSILAGLLAIWFVVSSDLQRSALLVAAGGLAGVWLGIRLVRRDHRIVGGLLGAGGGGALLLAFSRVGGGSLGMQLEFYPGVIGLLVLTVGLGPIYRKYERLYVTSGTALVFVSVVTAGVVQSATTWDLLAAGVATVVAWDLGEQAINLRNHVGGDARTWPVELTHGGAAAAVGAGAMFLAIFVENANVKGVPLAGLGVMLGAAVVLTTALYN